MKATMKKTTWSLGVNTVRMWSLLLAIPSTATAFVTAPRRLVIPSLPATLVLSSSVSQTVEEVAVEEPTLELLEEWSREYLAAAGKAEQGSGVEEISHWFAEDYIQTGPDIGPLIKKDYIFALSTYKKTGFDLYKASPDLTASLDGFHIDPQNKWRVWFTLRYIGTHTDTITLPNSDVEISPKKGDNNNKILGGPEIYSFWFTPEKQIKWQTLGYVGDRHTGTNQGYGAVTGLLVSMGVPRIALDLFTPVIKIQSWLSQFGLGDDSVPRTRSATKDLPQWWKDRTKLGLNLN